MNVYQGKIVFGGIAIGHLCVYQKGEQQVTRQKIEDVEAEVKRFQVAREQMPLFLKCIRCFWRMRIIRIR